MAIRPPHEVLSAFGLDNSGQWMRIALGSLNTSFLFCSGRGERLHLKEIRSPRAFRSLNVGLHHSQRLRCDGVPAPVIRPTRACDLYARCGDDAWVLTEWIHGRHLEVVSPATAAAIGRLVARLHASLNQHGLREQEWSIPNPWTETTATWEQVSEGRAALPAEMRDHVRWLCQEYDGDEFCLYEGTELVGSIFGDLWVGQFLFTDQSSICALLDWDDAGTESAIGEELAGMLFRSFMTDDASVPLRGAAGSFVRAYQQTYPLPLTTWVGVRERMIASGRNHLLQHISAWLRNEPRTRVASWRAHIIFRCRRLRWLVGNPAASADRWAAELATLIPSP
jgi:Ser/Thr protein kinase RdoA (MazF antagonist)